MAFSGSDFYALEYLKLLAMRSDSLPVTAYFSLKLGVGTRLAFC